MYAKQWLFVLASLLLLINVKADSSLVVPQLQSLLNMDAQEYSACKFGDVQNRYALDPALPKPDFFLVGLSLPSAIEIIKYFGNRKSCKSLVDQNLFSVHSHPSTY